MNRIFSSTLLALVAMLALTACGSDNSGGSGGGDGSGGSDFNDADVTFAQSMIPHHEQAVEMAKMGKMQASSPEVKNLANKIESAQGPEIATLKGWLKDWASEESDDSMGGMDHGSGMDREMPGMMSDEDMAALEQATGAAFDKVFLTMMIEHHSGAIEMAQTEQADGKNADAKALAKKIETDQTAEISEMQKLLNS